ncbi:uncharacterized protein LOC131611604 [Vicia villosa]|uniref:uncharacterized protein LOC131611604 n=1 Tax=Vicia villosa TaxID=3911 RepID=UPI00273B7331|nr:uncharacterized protein LOC131611604 [Vicia villosa]
MSTEVKRPNLPPHSKTASLQTSKMQNLPSEKGDQLLKTLFRKSHQNVIQSKPPKDSKKKASVSCVQNQDGKKVLKENKCKSSTKSNMCFCSPTTHEGSFRCRLHRISAPKKSATEKKTNVRCSKFAHGIVEFKPQLSRFGSHDSLIQLSRLGSS